MSPDHHFSGSAAEAGSTTLGRITPVMLENLRATKPWVRLLSIVGFVGSTLLLMAALVLPLVGALTNELGGAAAGVAMGGAYLLIGCLYFFPSLFLFRYANAIRSLLINSDERSMELALSHQKSFWRLVGIATLVLLAVYGVVFFVVIVAGVGAALA